MRFLLFIVAASAVLTLFWRSSLTIEINNDTVESVDACVFWGLGHGKNSGRFELHKGDRRKLTVYGVRVESCILLASQNGREYKNMTKLVDYQFRQGNVVFDITELQYYENDANSRVNAIVNSVHNKEVGTTSTTPPKNE